MEQNYTVYMHKNKINGKVYIGITKMKPEERWKNGWGYYTQLIFWRAICKYTFDGFEHIIIERNLTKKQAQTKEKELIKLYNSNNKKYGYNITKGGECTCTNWKGKHHTKESKEKIGKANKNNKRPDLAERNKNNNSRKKKVYQYDKSGNYINCFNSTREAELLTNISHNNISACCLNKINTAGGFIFSYKKEKYIKPRENKKEKKIMQYDSIGNLINIYNSIVIASNETRINKSAINNNLHNLSKTAGGYHWQYYEINKEEKKDEEDK